MSKIEELEQSIKDTLHAYDSDLSERLAPILASIIATAYSQGYTDGCRHSSVDYVDYGEDELNAINTRQKMWGGHCEDGIL